MTRVVIDNSGRDQEIVALKAEQPRLSNDAIGAMHGIGRERVRQILSRAEREQRRRTTNAPAIAKFKAMFEKYEALRSKG